MTMSINKLLAIAALIAAILTFVPGIGLPLLTIAVILLALALLV